MIDYVNTEIAVYSLEDYPENFEFPLSSVGSQGEEYWYIYFPDVLGSLHFDTKQNYNLLVGQTVNTTAYVYNLGSYQYRPYSYAFFETGSYVYYEGDILPVYMVIVARYNSTDSLNYGSHTYQNSIAYYGLAYYAVGGSMGENITTYRLDLGYVPSAGSQLFASGILRTLYNIGQFFVNGSNRVLDILNIKVLNMRLWEILASGGFAIYAYYSVIKWINPL